MRRFVVLTVALSLAAVALWAFQAGGRSAPDHLESDAAISTLETIDSDTAATGLAADRAL